MEKSITITAMILGTVLLLAIIGAVVYHNGTTKQTVQVNGASTVHVTPDRISIQFNVETNGTTAKEAKDNNAVIVDRVITALIKQGYERTEIETTNFNIWEDFDWSKNERTSLGYKATHQINVQVKTNDQIGETIDSGVDAGASISYINFELSQELQNQYKAEAIKLATQDARTKAEAMAEGLGAKLGSIVSVTNSEFNYYPWMAYDTMAAKAEGSMMSGESIETNIQPGERDVNANVQAVYQLR